jgi:hypothetical protein
MTDEELIETYEKAWGRGHDSDTSMNDRYLAGLRAVAEAAVRAHDRQADDVPVSRDLLERLSCDADLASHTAPVFSQRAAAKQDCLDVRALLDAGTANDKEN